MRVTHWMFVASVAGAWLTRGGEQADLHAVFGYVALGALAVRIAWGFMGPTHARFASFAYTPLDAARYVRDALRGSARHYTGHNPAGSWAVWTLLALIALTTLTGVLAAAGMHGLGPLAGRVGFATGDAAFTAHEVLAWIILGVALLHLAGVAWGSRVHRENLAAAMITGRKIDHDPAIGEAPRRSLIGTAIVVLSVAFGYFYLDRHVPADVQARAATEKDARVIAATQPWTRECGSCHLAYPPALLPLRSWERTMVEQERHFGEDLSLSAASIARLLADAHAAPPSWAAWKLASSVPAGSAPLRVTELPRWLEMHARLPPARFKPPQSAGRHDCEACHRDAASGIFHPRMIQSAKPRNGP